jgi:hypothetical protein
MKYVPSISMAAGQYSAMMLTKRDVTGCKLYVKTVASDPDVPPIEIEGGEGTLLVAPLRAGTKGSLATASWRDITTTVDPYLRWQLANNYMGFVGVFLFRT